MDKNIIILVVAYLMGSFPTAVIITRLRAGMDIRNYGDGNMGSRNVKHLLGWGASLLVVGVDISKGALAIILARLFGLSLGWQLATGVCAIIGHDFPIYVHFKGGQGMATIVGVLLGLVPYETLLGLAVFGVIYIITKNFDVSAALGVIVILGSVWKLTASAGLIIFIILLFISVPVKKLIDRARRQRIAEQLSSDKYTEISVHHRS